MDFRALAASTLKAQFKGLEIEENNTLGVLDRRNFCVFEEKGGNRAFVVVDLQKQNEYRAFYEIYREVAKTLPGVVVLFCLVTFKAKLIIYEFSESDSI